MRRHVLHHEKRTALITLEPVLIFSVTKLWTFVLPVRVELNATMCDQMYRCVIMCDQMYRWNIRDQV